MLEGKKRARVRGSCLRRSPDSYGGSRLRSLFEPHGEVHDASIIKDRATGESKGTCRRVCMRGRERGKTLMRAGMDTGCAFLVMTKRKDGAIAIAALHGKHTVQGRCLCGAARAVLVP